ncbi:MAG: M48 family metalloprotease [Paracoccaceae bacterium]
MKIPSQKTLEAHSKRYPTSIFLDLQLGVLALLFAALSFLTFPTYALVTFAMGCSVILSFHIFDSVKVLRNSARIRLESLNEDYHVRCGPRYNWQVRSVFFRPVILVPDESDSASRIIHEIGHIRSGDHRLFLFIKPIMLLLFICYMSIFSYGFASMNWSGILSGENMPPAFFMYSFFFMTLTIPIVSLFLVGAIFLAKREREYLADMFADGIDPESYRAHIRHQGLCEQCEFCPSTGVRLWNWFASPSYAERYRHLSSKRFILLKLGLFSGVLAGTPLILLKFVERAGQNTLGDVAGRIFSITQNDYALVLLFNGALLGTTAFIILYSVSLVAFTVSNGGATEALSRYAMFALGMFIPKAVVAYPDQEIYSQNFRSIWLQQSFDFWFEDALIILVVLLIFLLIKRLRGFLEAQSFKDSFAMSVLVLVTYWWLTA